MPVQSTLIKPAEAITAQFPPLVVSLRFSTTLRDTCAGGLPRRRRAAS
jgi:hypothetical protein